MFSRRTLTVWIGILLLSGMFLTGQETWPPPQCPDGDRDGYGAPASASCAHPELDCDDSNAEVNPGIIEGPDGDPRCSDGLDNDCDGLAASEDPDCELCRDGFEPNETCDGYFSLGTVYSHTGEQSWTARIYPAGDEDTFRFLTMSYDLCNFEQQEHFYIRIRMVPPQGAPCKDYSLFLYDDGCNLLQASTRPGCEEESITFSWDIHCEVDDFRYFRVRVSGVDGSYDCGDYELYLDLWRS